MRTPAAVRWISAEPLLGRVDLCETFGMWWNQTMNCFESSSSSGFNRNPNNQRETAIDWVVVGGESGPKARPMHPAWARALRDQCAAAGVPLAQATSMNEASARAFPNIALVKYWGKQDTSLILPVAGSLSLTLDTYATTTTVRLDPDAAADSF